MIDEFELLEEVLALELELVVASSPMRLPPITVHVHVDVSGLERLERKVDRILETQGALRMAMTELDAAIAQLEADVAADTALDSSAITLLDRLGDLIEQNATDPVQLRALADRIRSTSSTGGASNVNLAEALTRNTPAEAPPAGGDGGGGEPVG